MKAFCLLVIKHIKYAFNRIIIVTMFVNAENIRLSGRVVPPLAAGRSPTDDFLSS